jgi:hypothetical protein
MLAWLVRVIDRLKKKKEKEKEKEKKQNASDALDAWLLVFMTFSSWVSAEHPSRPRRRHHRYLRRKRVGKFRGGKAYNVFFLLLFLTKKKKKAAAIVAAQNAHRIASR